jgi:hypothetical protein
MGYNEGLNECCFDEDMSKEEVYECTNQKGELSHLEIELNGVDIVVEVQYGCLSHVSG